MARLTKVTSKISTSWPDMIDHFLLYKQAQGIGDRTISDYQYHLTKFFEKFPDISSYDELEKCVLRLFAEKTSPGYHNIRRKNLRPFFQWCMEEGVIPANPILKIKMRKDEGRIRPIPEEDLIKLLSLPNLKTYVGLRDYSLMLLSLDNGIRPSEATKLEMIHINTKSKEVFVSPEIAKTGVSRTLPISKETASYLGRLMALNEKTWGVTHVFCSCEGRQLTDNAWKLRMKVYSKKLKSPISAYDLRHAFAILYLRNGGDAFSLQRLMGHTDMEMTKRYLKFSQADLQNSHAGASPLTSLLGKKRKVVKLKE